MSNSTKVKIDPEDMTLDELEELEDRIGGSFDEAFDAGKPKVAVLKVIVWILRRRDEPALTLDDVGSVKLSDIDLGDDDEGEAQSAAA